MKTNPVTIARDALLQDASQLMTTNGIRHLPVTDGDQLVGFITESDLRQFSFPAMVEDITVEKVMVLNPITINANSSIETAAKLIHDFKIGGMPVLEKKKLIGILTTSDLLNAFIEVMGLLKASARIDIIINKKGGMNEVTRIIREHDCEILSVASETHSSRRKVHYFRVDKCDLDPVVKALSKAGHKVVSVMEY
ncbi:MAG: CBS and ACT domain-containing protein [Desulfobulbaceae bacterium]|nr:CBS and ACT domain-containing protein [Desulfobulbaceae bacterium]